MRMYAAIGLKDWDKYKPRSGKWGNRLLMNGIKAGDVEGSSNGKPVILVQHTPFAWGCDNDKCMIVEFDKPLAEIYVDWDDAIEVVEDHLKPEQKMLWEIVDIVQKQAPLMSYAMFNEEDLADHTLYGSYVLDIKPEEIIKVHTGEWVNNEVWLFDGKPD